MDLWLRAMGQRIEKQHRHSTASTV